MAVMTDIEIRDHKGEKMGSFVGNAEEGLCSQAQDAGIPVPMSCGVGACRTCVAKVVEGREWIDEEAVGPKMIEVEDDEILTCICSLKPNTPANTPIILTCENL